MGEETSQIREIIVDETGAGNRIDKFLVGLLPQVTRSQLQKWIEEGRITVDGQACRASHQVRCGSRITLPQGPGGGLPTPAPGQAGSLLLPREAAFEIMYEDEFLLVINKPAGLVVHPGVNTQDATLAEGVLFHLAVGDDDALQPNDLRPGIVHRLDKDTTGVMVVAKDALTHADLALQFKEKSNLREYIALVHGILHEGETTVESYLHRDPRHRLRFASLSREKYEQLAASGKDLAGYRYAKTLFLPRKIYGERLSLLMIRLYTGRTHQIRVHARTLGIPICGDPLYGSSVNIPKGAFPSEIMLEIKALKRQLLHARLLGFTHPHSRRKLAFEAPLPDDFKKIISLLEKYAADK